MSLTAIFRDGVTSSNATSTREIAEQIVAEYGEVLARDYLTDMVAKLLPGMMSRFRKPSPFAPPKKIGGRVSMKQHMIATAWWPKFLADPFQTVEGVWKQRGELTDEEWDALANYRDSQARDLISARVEYRNYARAIRQAGVKTLAELDAQAAAQFEATA